MTDRASSDRGGGVSRDAPEAVPPSGDLLDAFEEAGWKGDLAGALSEAPFLPPPVDADHHEGDWRTLFQDYLTGLPDHLRNKYAIRQSG